MRRIPDRRPSYDDYYGTDAHTGVPGDEADIASSTTNHEIATVLNKFYELQGTTLTLNDIEVTVTKDTDSFLPGFGYFVDACHGVTGFKFYCFTLWGARRRAQREYDRLMEERDGHAAPLLTLKDDPVNPPLTYVQEKAIRREADMAAWDEMAAAVGK